MSDDTSPLIYGYAVDEDGTVRKLNWDEVSKAPIQDAGPRVWVHLNRLMPEARQWVSEISGLDAGITDALFREETRPRAASHPPGWLVNLRGINFNDGDQDDVMIALRIYADENIIVTTRALKILAAEDLSKSFDNGTPPPTNGDIIAYFAERLIIRMEPVVETLADRIDEIEDLLIEGNVMPVKSALTPIRRHAIALRRFMSPQREALSVLGFEDGAILSEQNRLAIRNTQNILLRISEELESVRDRAQIIQEQIAEHRAEEMNTRLFVLSIISAIFLPLGFVSGLFGVNVGGMPGVDSPYAFTALCLGMIGVVGGLFWLFRKLGWLN